MPKILVIAYYFPPLGGGGVQRTAKFVKFLPGFGWQPVVLTIQSNSAYLHDNSQLNLISTDLKVYRTSTLSFPTKLPWRVRSMITRWILLVDQEVGWLPFAVTKARTIIEQEKIEVIYSTSAPYTAHLIGWQLKKNTGLPWLADFRDPWVGNFSRSFPTTFHKIIALRLEQRVVSQANRVLVVSEPMRRELLRRYTTLDPAHVVTLPNGFDPADFTGVEPSVQTLGHFTIVYTGSFYGQQQTPYYFLLGLRTALDKGQLSSQNVKVYFVGSVGKTAPQYIEEFGLTNVVEMVGYIPHQQSIAYLLGADVLLLVIGSGPGSEVVFTGKIFEYLAAGKPILALVPPGVAADLLAEAGVGYIVPPEEPAAIAAALVDLFVAWKANTLAVSPDPSVVARYDRRQQTGQLAKILDEMNKVNP